MGWGPRPRPHLDASKSEGFHCDAPCGRSAGASAQIRRGRPETSAARERSRFPGSSLGQLWGGRDAARASKRRGAAPCLPWTTLLSFRFRCGGGHDRRLDGSLLRSRVAAAYCLRLAEASFQKCRLRPAGTRAGPQRGLNRRRAERPVAPCPGPLTRIGRARAGGVRRSRAGQPDRTGGSPPPASVTGACTAPALPPDLRATKSSAGSRFRSWPRWPRRVCSRSARRDACRESRLCRAGRARAWRSAAWWA